MAVSWTSGWQLQGNLTFQVVTDEGFSVRIFLKPLVPTISQHQYNTWKKIDRNREKYQLWDCLVIQYEILWINIVRMVKQMVRRISNKILGVTGFNVSFPSKALNYPLKSCFIPLVNKNFLLSQSDEGHDRKGNTFWFYSLYNNLVLRVLSSFCSWTLW